MLGQLEHFMGLAIQVVDNARVFLLMVARDFNGAGETQALIHRCRVEACVVPAYRALHRCCMLLNWMW